MVAIRSGTSARGNTRGAAAPRPLRERPRIKLDLGWAEISWGAPSPQPPWRLLRGAAREPPLLLVMNRSLLIVAAGLLAPVVLATNPVSAQEVSADTGRTHVVRTGDTLWDLSELYLSNPFRWPEIFGINRDVVADPHWIYPTERLRIPGARASVAAAPASGYLPPVPGDPPQRTVFYPVADARPANELVTAADAAEVTVVTSGDFQRAGRLVPEREIRPVGQLVEVAEASVVIRRLERQIHPRTRVYMKVAPGADLPRIGDALHLWRPGRAVRPHGRIYESTGTARVVAVDGGVATVEVDRLFSSVEIGDLALPAEPFTVPGGVIPRPASGVEGQIVAFAFPQSAPSIEDVAFLNLGADAGVVEGDEFEVVLPPRRTAYGARPEIAVARLQVVRVSPRTSAARVVQLRQPALETGQVVRLVGKMP